MADQKLTPQELRDLAEAERMMDDGRMLYVVLRGERVSVRREVMDELGLQPRQTINDTIFGAILDSNLAHVQTLIALDKAKAAAKPKS